MKPLALALVGLGGAAGAIARYLIGYAVAARVHSGWPWGTFLINVSGCLIIGFFVTYTTEKVAVSDAWRYLVPIGFVGAYTTFSSYELELHRLGEAGQWVRALSYLVASTVVGFLAIWLATLAARRV